MQSKATYFICALIAIGVGLFGGWFTFDKYSLHNRYPSEGKIAEAYPTSDHYTETRKRFGIKSYDTDLAFTADNGQTIHLKNTNISKDELAILQTGKPIEREYLPDDPQNTARAKGDMMGIWIGLALMLVGLGIGIYYMMVALGKAKPDNPSD